MNRRTWAQRLSHHTLEVVPPGRRDWARGMVAEVEHIEDDGAALDFALGAVWTAYREGAGLRSNWLRLGRWSVALSTVGLGLLTFYVSLWLPRLPARFDTPVPFSGVLVLLSVAYLGAGWGLARRRLGAFFGLIAITAALVATTILAFAAGADAALPLPFYSALLAGEPVPSNVFYAALLLEQCVFVGGLTAWGLFFWRFERPKAVT